jgi:transcriptional regulator with XRE-family HTH domain
MSANKATPRYPAPVVKPGQVRGARGLLGWTQARLAEESGVAVNSIRGFEAGIVDMRVGTLERIVQALEAGGVQFIGKGEVSPRGGPGVRLRR